MSKYTPVSGQISIYDVMDKRDFLQAGDEIESEKDIADLVGEPIADISANKGKKAWVRFDLSSGTIYELNTILGADGSGVRLFDGNTDHKTLSDRISTVHPNGFLYEVRAAA
jgi:hypothetical protein